jgi:predicted nucleic acid-binding protein
MLTYLYDASAAVELYVPSRDAASRAAHFILDQRVIHKQAITYIPNFCIAEVFNTLARKHLRPKGDEPKLSRQQHEDCLDRFRNDVHWGKKLYSYDLNRYHIVAVDDIIPREHDLDKETEWDHPSTFDILVIAMAAELAYLGKPKETYLVTCDRRLKRVAEQLTGEDVRDRRVLKDVPVRRWHKPNILYLHHLRKGDLKSVPGQAFFNP